jgi:hypothetical protein
VKLSSMDRAVVVCVIMHANRGLWVVYVSVQAKCTQIVGSLHTGSAVQLTHLACSLRIVMYRFCAGKVGTNHW